MIDLMDPRKLFADERHSAFCVFCGAPPTTREHVASRVLLDDPLPENLPLVYSCLDCNNGFSRDEEYLSCLIDCVISGSIDPEVLRREKVRASLRHSPALAARIAAGRTSDASGNLLWKPDEVRVQNVIVKLARGHAAHQYGEPHLDEPEYVTIVPLELMSPDERDLFECIPDSRLFPELGSRAFINLIITGNALAATDCGWAVLQAGRYRYSVAQPGETVVRMVLSEYLACEVGW